MKRTIKTIMIGAAAILFAATSCQKDETPAAKTNDPISISIQGGIGDFTPADGVKATTESVIRVKWEAGDKVYVYDGKYNLGALTVSITNPKTGETDARYAYLTGTLTNTPQLGTELLTLVYVKGMNYAPVNVNSRISFDISAQSGNDFPFMLYATLPFETGMTEITNKFVPFKFATSVMKVNCANLVEDAGNITFASINDMNTVCVLTLNKAAAPTVSGTTSGTIVRTGEFASGNGKCTFMVAVAPTEAVSLEKNRYINIRQGNESYIGMQLTNAQLKDGYYYSTICSVKSKKPADQECVYIAGTWWAKQNLAITASGRKGWKGYNEIDAVTVPGTGDAVINGDYFQWAAYPGYCGNATDADKGLLVYNSFTSSYCGDGSKAFEFKSSGTGKKYRFSTSDYNNDRIGISPYYDKTEKKYTKYTSGSANLEKSDDVANIILGGSWHIPTTEEFMTIRNVCYLAWDATDRGYYVFMPRFGTNGSAGKRADISTTTDTKSDASLFFPNVGGGINDTFTDLSSYGLYWSNSLDSSDTSSAYYWRIYYADARMDYYDRHRGFTVRPVSD